MHGCWLPRPTGRGYCKCCMTEREELRVALAQMSRPKGWTSEAQYNCSLSLNSRYICIIIYQ